MFDLGDKVIIKSSSIIGTIADIADISGKLLFTVESDRKGISKRRGGYGGDWKLFECGENDIAAYNIKTA